MPKTHTEIAEDIRRHGEYEAPQTYSVIDQINRPVSVMRSDGHIVANFFDMSSTREERVAHARRFAASECMLAALKEAEKLLASEAATHVGIDYRALAMVRAAIAQAKGE